MDFHSRFQCVQSHHGGASLLVRDDDGKRICVDAWHRRRGQHGDRNQRDEDSASCGSDAAAGKSERIVFERIGALMN